MPGFVPNRNVSPDELHLCHRLNEKARDIVKFKCRKHRQNVLYNRKNLQSKGYKKRGKQLDAEKRLEDHMV